MTAENGSEINHSVENRPPTQEEQLEAVRSQISGHIYHIQSLGFGMVESAEKALQIVHTSLPETEKIIQQMDDDLKKLVDTTSYLDELKGVLEDIRKPAKPDTQEPEKSSRSKLDWENLFNANVARVVHDLRNPMAPTGILITMTTRALALHKSPTDIESYLKRVHSSVIKFNSISPTIENRLFDPYPEGSFSINDLYKLLKADVTAATLALYKDQNPGKKAITLKMTPIPRPLLDKTISLHPIWTQPISGNIAQNLLRAAERRDEEQSDRTDPKKIEISLHGEGNNMVMQVEDTFAGFPKDFKLGDSTTKSSGTHGLGLPQLVEALTHYGGDYAWGNTHKGAVQKFTFKLATEYTR